MKRITIVLMLIYILLSSCKKNDIPLPSTVTDIDGNIYNTVKIGDQLWMKENLRTASFSNGDPIPTTDPLNMVIEVAGTPIYQWSYFDDEQYSDRFGRYYTWYTVKDERNICPNGWHVSLPGDWDKLISFLGGANIAGGKLKETGIEFWWEPNDEANNMSDFSAVATGARLNGGHILNKVTEAYFWTPVELDFTLAGQTEKYWAICYILNNESPVIEKSNIAKNSGLTVRCVMNMTLK